MANLAKFGQINANIVFSQTVIHLENLLLFFKLFCNLQKINTIFVCVEKSLCAKFLIKNVFIQKLLYECFVNYIYLFLKNIIYNKANINSDFVIAKYHLLVTRELGYHERENNLLF